MKIIYSKNFPPKDFTAINLFGLIIARNDHGRLSDEDILHERIHSRQIVEMLVIFFYPVYFIEWLIRLIQYRDTYLAYRNISFEREAYQGMEDSLYLKKRKIFAFIHYLKR